jgi:hypothetical protein
VPNLSGLPALDVLLGLSFVYFLLSIVCSSANEAIAVALKLRARTLEHGIRSLLGGDQRAEQHAIDFYCHWRVQALMKPPTGRLKKAIEQSGPGKLSKTLERKLADRKPSYMPSRVFGLTLLDTFAPPDDDATSHDVLAQARRALASKDLPQPVRGFLVDALSEADGDVTRFRHALERPFDEVMDRASGWYKRRVQIIMFCIALVLAVAVNADTFAIGQRLWKDDALRTAVVATANKGLGSQDKAAACAKLGKNPTAVDVAASCVDQVQQLKLPIGWANGAPHGWGYGSKLIGLLITAFALTLGAPFWFDLLGKVATLRGTGPATPGGEAKGAQGAGPPAPPPEKS